MDKEIFFKKYETRGADYHYQQINKANLTVFNAYVLARYQIEMQQLIRSLKKYSSNSIIKVLDIGCGDGVFFYLFNKVKQNKKIQLFGVDNSKIALDIAKKKNPIDTFKLADAYALPFNDNYFDIIISSDIIEHLLKVMDMLSEIKRVGKNESTIIIGTPIRFLESPKDKMHQKEFYPQEFKVLLDKYFNNIKIIKSHKLRYFLYYEKSKIFFRRKIFIYRYLINFLAIYLKKNLFLQKNKLNDKQEFFSYMFAIGEIRKDNI